MSVSPKPLDEPTVIDLEAEEGLELTSIGDDQSDIEDPEITDLVEDQADDLEAQNLTVPGSPASYKTPLPEEDDRSSSNHHPLEYREDTLTLAGGKTPDSSKEENSTFIEINNPGEGVGSEEVCNHFLLKPGDTEGEGKDAMDEPSESSSGCKIKIASAALVVVLAVIVSVVLSSLHKIDEGSVGIYFRYGALQDVVTYPGIHHMAPFIVTVKEIQIRPQTDTMPPLMSITKDGIQNTFIDVQVISRVKVEKLVPMVKKFGLNFRDSLIYDRVKEELRIFCANHTIDEVYNSNFLDIVNNVERNLVTSIERLGEGGIEILNLVVPKPDIPDDIAFNYKQVKVQWTEQLVATQQQKTEQIKKETEKIRAIADAERNKSVLEIKIQERILEREGDQKVSLIQNQILKEREENNADISQYKVLKEAEANLELHTDKYVKLNMAQAMTQNTKFYFSGEKSELGALLGSIFKNPTPPN